MPQEILDRRASDNEYLHRDFHGALSVGIQYLDQHYGEDAVRRYLREFTLTYYAPLRAALLSRGLSALREHFEELYRVEGGDVSIEESAEELLIHVRECPAVRHMRANDYPVARLFHETTRTVNEALCEGTPFSSELLVTTRKPAPARNAFGARGATDDRLQRFHSGLQRAVSNAGRPRRAAGGGRFLELYFR